MDKGTLVTFRLKHDTFEIEYWEKAAELWFWYGGHFVKVQTAD